ncbi:MAG: hypothetical protein AB7G25_19000 [Sphingomonadaceae bacterium]
MVRQSLIATAALVLSASAIAQDNSLSAIDAREQAVTQELNRKQAMSARTEITTMSAQQDQYALDRAAFRAEIAARREKMAITEEEYAKREAAYAEAMAAWRIQNDECDRGILKSCKKPTPMPADFYQP